MAVKSRVPARRADAPRPGRPRRQNLFWSRLHFLIRFLGLTGAMVGCAGFVLAKLNNELVPLDSLASWQDAWTTGADFVRQAFENAQERWRTVLLLVGAAAALLALLVEAVVVLCFTASRRSAFGLNAVLQGALAALLVVLVNVLSFNHYWRVDFTRDQKFTLPPSIRGQLAQLDRDEKNKTTVVVYQRHKTFGTLAEKPDRYDYAAERKVVEKVKEVAELLGHLGPQLKVEVLDIEQEGFEDRLKEVTKMSLALRRAIETATENSIFIQSGGQLMSFQKFNRLDAAARQKIMDAPKNLIVVESGGRKQQMNFDEFRQLDEASRRTIEEAPENYVLLQSDDHVRQMSFDEFYQLDKVASRQANDGQGNLVLLAQGSGTSGHGFEALASKILNLQERRPRVGVLVVHELLTTEGSEDAFTLRGLRKTLEAHGFEVRDVVLRKGWENGMLEPAANTFEESKLERLEVELADLDEEITALEKGVEALDERIREWSLNPGEKLQDKLDRLSKNYARELGDRQLTAKGREVLLAYFEGLRTQVQQDRDDKTKERKEKRKEYQGLNKDRVIEARRMSDLKAKLNRALIDCDLLFVPRLTRRGNGALVPNRVHRLSDAQVECIKDFMQKGKPVLACLGPTNEMAELGLPPDIAGPDNLEKMLGELGFRFGKQTVLFNTDSKAFEDRRRNPLRQAVSVEPPPLDFDTPPQAASGSWLRWVDAAPLPPNPLREALRVTAHSAGSAFDLRLRFPRPIYFEPAKGQTPQFEPTFLLTANGWNDNQPFAVRGHRPHYEKPKPDDPDNGTIQARRRGAFPVGVAIDTPLPASWMSSAGTARTVRVAVIGQAEVFVGAELRPAKERLLLQTANWLLGRDDYLARADHPWSYPRVPLSPESVDYRLWLLGAISLPLLFAYLGLVMLLIRRLR